MAFLQPYDHLESIPHLLQWIESESLASHDITRRASSVDNTAPKFLPNGRIEKYFQEPENDFSRVRNLLRAVFDPDGARAGQFHVSARDVAETCSRVFCILVLMGKPEFIETFVVYDSLWDICLPFGSSPPHGFPHDPSDPSFYEKFRRTQWQFCALTVRQHGCLRVSKDQVLPFIDSERLRGGETADVHRVEIHPDHDAVILSTLSSHIYAIKTFRGNVRESNYEQKHKAFQQVTSSGTRGTPGLIESYGGFEYHGTFNLILQYADAGTLEEVFRREDVPNTGEEIISFWTNLLEIVKGVCQIHEQQLRTNGGSNLVSSGVLLQRWHQDIRPENIFALNNADGSTFTKSFKIADLGQYHFKTIMEGGSETQDFDTSGTRTYNAPGRYHWDTLPSSIIKRSADIWSLGCVLSESFVWVLKGWKGLREFRAARKRTTEAIPGFDGADCFHDGYGMLAEVRSWFEGLKEEIKTQDYVSGGVLEEIIYPTLQREPELRPSAGLLVAQSETLLRNARADLQRQPLVTSPISASDSSRYLSPSLTGSLSLARSSYAAKSTLPIDRSTQRGSASLTFSQSTRPTSVAISKSTHETAKRHGDVSRATDQSFISQIPLSDMDHQRGSSQFSIASRPPRIGDEGKLRGRKRFALEIFNRLPPDMDVDANDDLNTTIRESIVIFSRMMELHADFEHQREATNFLLQEAGEIARDVLARFIRHSSSPSTSSLLPVDRAAAHRRAPSTPLDIQEWIQKSTGTEVLPQTSGIEELPSHPHVHERKTAEDVILDHVHDVFTHSVLFDWMLERVTTLAPLTRTTTFESIARSIITGMRKSLAKGAAPHARFFVDWDPRSFFKAQFKHDGDLGKLITHTSDRKTTQATTVEAYMSQVWPTTGPIVLRMLREFTSGENWEIPTQWKMSERSISIAMHGSQLFVDVASSAPEIVEIGEQLSWLGCACRESPQPDTQSTCLPSIEPTQVSTDEHRDGLQPVVGFRLSFIAESRSYSNTQPGNCWRQLFRNICVAEGFPVSVRDSLDDGQEMFGLEIPLTMMAALGGARQVTIYSGQLMLKGIETLFVPVARTASSLLWHMMYSPGDRISYNTWTGRGVPSLLFNDLHRFRHFLGWASNASQHAGTTDGEYASSKSTFLEPVKPGYVLEKASISLSKMIGLSLSFAIVDKDRGVSTSDSDLSYNDVVRHLGNMHVLLYDHPEQRGWLLDGASVTLHILRLQMEDPELRESDCFNIQNFVHAEPAGGCDAAKQALKENRWMQLSEDSGAATARTEVKDDDGKVVAMRSVPVIETTYVETRVRKIFEILEHMFDIWRACTQASGVPIHMGDRPLEGWPVDSIIDRARHIYPASCSLNASASDWHRFVKKIDAIVLLGRDFGDMIRASGRVCPQWQSVPKKHCYLTVSVPQIKRICKAHGNSKSVPILLAKPDVHWQISGHPFKCECGSRSKRNMKKLCDPVQVISQTSKFRASIHPSEIFESTEHDSGALIFGGKALRKHHSGTSRTILSRQNNTDQAEASTSWLKRAFRSSGNN